MLNIAALERLGTGEVPGDRTEGRLGSTGGEAASVALGSPLVNQRSQLHLKKVLLSIVRPNRSMRLLGIAGGD